MENSLDRTVHRTVAIIGVNSSHPGQFDSLFFKVIYQLLMMMMMMMMIPMNMIMVILIVPTICLFLFNLFDQSKQSRMCTLQGGCAWMCALR